MKQSTMIYLCLGGAILLVAGSLFLLMPKENQTKMNSESQMKTSENTDQSKKVSQIESSAEVAVESSEPMLSVPKMDLVQLNQALLTATDQVNLSEIKQLLEQGAVVDTVNGKGESGLLVAAHEDNPEMAQLFLDYNANVNLQDKIQDSPFLYAGAEGRLEILTMMLTHNPDTKLTNRFGGNALIPAAEKEHLDMVRLLLSKTDVAVNHINTPGWTALLEAIVYTDGGEIPQQIIQVLLDNGADPNLADKQGITPIQHARQRGFQQIVSILKTAGAKD
ncbi:ankyrin repeat domain-containing protein [Carnobacterium gallinarum]|uniref:ankyrin repeat domain-containing protein n=1 Tax=Carnobacterium gallinarum TaxID=2749 RepID=UPI0005554552|nr:ankyrin repeat domain-containing protein [Carnobacterium gallinarum]